MERDVHFVRDLVASKSLQVHFISSKDRLADTFTKVLPTTRFSFLIDTLNVHELPLRLQVCVETTTNSTLTWQQLQFPETINHMVTMKKPIDNRKSYNDKSVE